MKTNRMGAIWLTTAAAVLLSGCATTSGTQLVENGKSALTQARICCETLQDVISLSMPIEKADHVLDEKSQAMMFDGQKSFFVMLALPKYDRPYRIVISSFSSGNATNAALFLPRISLHGADRKATREFDDKSLRSRGSSLERTIFINPENSAEQYLLIRASELSAKIEQNISIVTTSAVYVAPGVYVNISSGADSKVLVQSSPVGRLAIEVHGLNDILADKK